MTKDEALKMALKAFEWNYNTDLDNIPACEKWAKMLKENITAIKEALAQTQEPVAWVDPATLHHLKIGLEGVHLVYETEMVNSLPLYDKPQFANSKNYLERLIRIMGTFDLATGHANNFDELLDSLESELRDVLGHYRQQRTWVGLTDEEIKALASWWPSYDQMPALMVLAKDIQNSLKEKNA